MRHFCNIQGHSSLPRKPRKCLNKGLAKSQVEQPKKKENFLTWPDLPRYLCPAERENTSKFSLAKNRARQEYAQLYRFPVPQDKGNVGSGGRRGSLGYANIVASNYFESVVVTNCLRS